ncbi:MAG TPA: pyridoxal phosphate-dependent aminotransferase [Deltaproteobacteria bacterium]|nr:pyridoxal phosphate-dependent aminotransferase [Deltaproteobacteria bacterium]
MKLAERVKRIQPSATLAITAKANALRAAGRDIIGFGAGEPDFDTPENIKEAAIQAIKDGFTKYTPVGGIDELKDAIIDKLQNENNLSYSRSQIVASCGAKHTLYNLAQAIFEQGDEVIIPSPYWVSYPDIVLLADGTPVILQTDEADGFKVKQENLRRAITGRTKAIIINSPSNPTGSAYTLSELEALADVIVDAGILVISDDIYDNILYDGLTFYNICNVREELQEQTIVVNGVSKTYAMTGWRIGYAAGPEEIISAVTKIQSQNTSNPTSISQKASIEALRGDQRSVKSMIKEYKERRDYIVDSLNKINGLSCLRPQGAFYVFPNVSRVYGSTYGGKTITSSVELAAYLLDAANVAVVPGEAFGNDGYVRLSYATSMENIRRGMERITAAIGDLKR